MDLILTLMLRNRLPQLRILIDADFLARADLVVAMQLDGLGEKRDDVRIERLPVRVLQVIP